jgi:hypothetical protein
MRQAAFIRRWSRRIIGQPLVPIPFHLMATTYPHGTTTVATHMSVNQPNQPASLLPTLTHLETSLNNVLSTCEKFEFVINNVPTGTSVTRGPWTPEECHNALLTESPSYAALTITQKPRWVKDPNTYELGARSSLVVAFETPNGNLAQSIVISKYLYLFDDSAPVNICKPRPLPITPCSEGVHHPLKNTEICQGRKSEVGGLRSYGVGRGHDAQQD